MTMSVGALLIASILFGVVVLGTTDIDTDPDLQARTAKLLKLLRDDVPLQLLRDATAHDMTLAMKLGNHTSSYTCEIPGHPGTAQSLSAFDGLCFGFQQGWWAYRWCHQKFVHQVCTPCLHSNSFHWADAVSH